ncbi:MAG: SGNH/GDSL hydrolase family protein [Planctomycetota bacterium]
MRRWQTMGSALVVATGLAGGAGADADPGVPTADVVFAGDSMTAGYTQAADSSAAAPVVVPEAGSALDRDLAALRFDWRAAVVARGGVTAERWDRSDVAWAPRDPAGFSRVAAVNATGAELVVLMLGTNDVLQMAGAGASEPLTEAEIERRWSAYEAAMLEALDGLDAGRSPGTGVLLLKPLGVVAGPGVLEGVDAAAVNRWMDERVGPFLEGLAADRDGVWYFDARAAFEALPGWERYYADGIHLYRVIDGTYGFAALRGVLLPEVGRVLREVRANAASAE